MKKIALVLCVLVLVFACKTSKKVAQQPAIETEQVVEQIVEPKSEVKAITPVKEPVDDTPVVMRTEEVRLYEDNTSKAASFDFYVIIGSFSKSENAEKYKREMVAKGFTPVVLTTESGLYRVAIEQSNSESGARAFIKHIRIQFPEHKDVWLLKKK
jgi:cell division protein FtsN